MCVFNFSLVCTLSAHDFAANGTILFAKRRTNIKKNIILLSRAVSKLMIVPSSGIEATR